MLHFLMCFETRVNISQLIAHGNSWNKLNACGSIKLYFVFALMSYFSVLFLLLFLQDAGSHMLFLQYLHCIYLLIELTISFSKWTYLPKHRKFKNKSRSWEVYSMSCLFKMIGLVLICICSQGESHVACIFLYVILLPIYVCDSYFFFFLNF